MGSFSWLKADDLTNIENIALGMPFKFLIPKEFGGGFIKDEYQNYGDLGTKLDGSPKYNMYELLDFWNKDFIIPSEGIAVSEKLKYNGDMPLMKEIDEFTDYNRNIGIDIGCYDEQIDKLKYPLKLVSVSFRGSYEDLDKPSYGDPNQGHRVTKRR